jgi:hypothetical protein
MQCCESEIIFPDQAMALISDPTRFNSNIRLYLISTYAQDHLNFVYIKNIVQMFKYVNILCFLGLNWKQISTLKYFGSGSITLLKATLQMFKYVNTLCFLGVIYIKISTVKYLGSGSIILLKCIIRVEPWGQKLLLVQEPSGVYILETFPPLSRGEKISADIIWGKKYEKVKRKRRKM